MTRSPSTSRCSRSPPTRSTPRSPPRSPAPCSRSRPRRTRPEVGAELAIIGDSSEGGGDGGEDESAEDSSGGDDEAADESVETAPEQSEDEGTAPETDPDAGAESDDSGPSAHGSGESAGGDSSGGGGSGTPVTLPALGESVTEGTVTRWLKQVGDEVAVDEPLLEVSTDKVDTEIPSPVAGTLLEIKAEEDETVEVGAELAIIGDKSASSGGSGGADDSSEKAATPEAQPADEQQSEKKAEQEEQIEDESGELPPGDETPEREKSEAPKQEAPKQEAPKQEAPKQEAPKQEQSGDRSDATAYVTPLVRKMAAEHDVDLSTIEGTGVGGRIRKQDVLDAAAEKKEQASAPAQQAPAASSAPAASAPSSTPSPLRGKTEKLSRLRKIIASRMVESLQTTAQLTQVVEVDVTNIARMREAQKEEFLAREGVKLSYLPFFAKAAIDALKQHPALNATIDTEAGEVTFYDREHLSLAVDTEKGLITPVIKDAGDLSISGLAKKIADIAARTRTNKIGPDELSGGTFTITNLGSVGALWDTPIINTPQVAILGPGAVVKRPVVIDDPNLGETIAVRHMVYLALTYDHRLIDGADAGRFLTEVKQRLESGQFEI